MARSSINDIFPDLSPRAEIFEKVNLIEKNWLDQARITFPNQVVQLLNDCNFFRIYGGRAWYELNNSIITPIGFSSNFLEALYSQLQPIIYLVYCCHGNVEVHMGTISAGSDTLKALLSSGVGMDLIQESNPKYVFDNAQYCSALTGIPRLKDEIRQKGYQKSQSYTPGMKTLISPLIFKYWTYVVLAYPIYRQQTGQWFEDCAREIKDIKESFLLRDMQRHNRMASHYADILEKTLKRLGQGKQLGLWQSGIYFFSDQEATVASGASLLNSLLADNKTKPETIRIHTCSDQEGISAQINCLTSKELELPVSLPDKEYPGFCLREEVDFDLDQQTVDLPSISIGLLGDTKHGGIGDVRMPIADLSKHGLVAGLTGSGKTNTIFNLLSQLHNEHGLPFLVIEPAKSEYRNLHNQIQRLKVFTLGEERLGRSAPFRFNPFFFPQGVSLQTHLDMLKAVFQASFVMYAPMPYILEECLYKIYEDKGWNLVTSFNSRGQSALSFPILSDLYKKVDQVVDAIGYDDRLTMDIKSALKTRIKNLCLGGKGKMLNTRNYLPWADLMSQPVVLELKYLGSDEDKAFMMGLILMAIWEFYESHGEFHPEQLQGLKHLTVIEEAHRLLKNVPTEKASEEMSNVKGKGVETFCNLFAEIRAYGQGFLVSEQIPTKLAPEIIKNSNLKIMHRIVAKEDREVMGESMNMGQHQQRHTVSLKTGRAICFQEGMDRPVKIISPLSATKKDSCYMTGEVLCQTMDRQFYSLYSGMLDKFAACANCKLRGTEKCERVKQEIENRRNSSDWDKELVKIFLPFVLVPDWGDIWSHLTTVVDIPEDLKYCFSAYIIQDFIQAKGDFEQWSYDLVEERISEAQKEIQSGRYARMIGQYRSEKIKPFRLCQQLCNLTGCPCGFEIGVLSNDPYVHNQLLDLLRSSEYGPRFYQELIVLLVDTFRDLIPSRLNSNIQDLAVCYLIRKLNEYRITFRLQQEILESFEKNLQKAVSF